MALFDNISKKASETTAKAVQKAQGFSEISKMNLLISEEEKKTAAVYQQIGKLFVSVHGMNCESDFIEMVTSALEGERKINEYREQIRIIKGVQNCEKCGAEVAKNAAFCSSCGYPMPKEEILVSIETVECKNCGAMMKTGIRFCTSCGQSMLLPDEIMTSPAEINGGNKEKSCPNCGAATEDDLSFCTACGTKL